MKPSFDETFFDETFIMDIPICKISFAAPAKIIGEALGKQGFAVTEEKKQKPYKTN